MSKPSRAVLHLFRTSQAYQARRPIRHKLSNKSAQMKKHLMPQLINHLRQHNEKLTSFMPEPPNQNTKLIAVFLVSCVGSFWYANMLSDSPIKPNQN